MELKKYKLCPQCKARNRATSVECEKCETDLTGIPVVTDGGSGTPVTDNNTELVRVCDECGAENPAQSRKCLSCGEDISHVIPGSPKPKQETVTYALESVDCSFRAEFDKPVCYIGRETEMKEYLADKLFVSRQQAELQILNNKVFIKNVSKTNKTFVNNEPVPDDKPVQLTDGDEIGLGGKVIGGERQSKAAYLIFRLKK